MTRLTWCLSTMAGLILICGVIFGWPEHQPNLIFGRFRNNQGGVLMGALILILLYRLLITSEAKCWMLILPSLAIFVLFGSLGSSVALLFGLLALLIFWLGRRLGSLHQLLILAFGLPLVGLCAYVLVQVDASALQWIAAIKGQRADLVTSGTGRVELWEALWKNSSNNVLGYGFGAGDRLLVQLVPKAQIDFIATNAEDGYLSGWLSAGWLGLWSVALTFLGAALVAARQPYPDRAYMIPMLVFLAVNNISYRGVGGVFNVAWFVMMVLACAGPAAGAAQRGGMLPRAPVQSREGVRLDELRPRPVGSNT